MRNFKKIVPVFMFIIIILLVNQILFLALKPLNFFRNDVHNMRNGDYDTLYVGSSHGKSAIQPEIIEDVTGESGINMCLGGEYPIDSYYIVKEMCRKEKPKTVVYELDPGYWVSKASLGPDYTTVYEEMPWSNVKVEYLKSKLWNVDFRAALFPWYVYRQGYRKAFSMLDTKLSKEYLAYSETTYNDEYQYHQEDGSVYIRRTDIPKTEDNLLVWDEDKLKQQSKEYFDKMVEYCNQNEIELIVITTPIPEETLVKYDENFKAADEYFTEYMKRNSIPYYNFNNIKIEGFDNSLDGFGDYEGHMYGDQAEIFSRDLGNYLK